MRCGAGRATLNTTMNTSLRSRLIGAWTLLSYVEQPVDGSPAQHPFGLQPQGLILYTPDGYMSAQLSAERRQPFAGGDWFKGTPEEYTAQGSSYIAYTGAFEVDELQQTLAHRMFVSLYPNWVGQTQPRLCKIEGDILSLSTASPILSAGQRVNSYLRWQRAPRN